MVQKLFFACIALALFFSGCIQLQSQVKDCGNDVSCFGEAFKECSKAKVVVQQDMDSFSSSMLIEVKGFEDDKCLWYAKLTDVSILLEEKDELTQKFAQVFTDLEGKEMSCAISTPELSSTDVLSEDFEMDKYCEGSLVQSVQELSQKIEEIINESLTETLE